MPTINASALHWATPDGRPVLRGVDIHLACERVGLVGRNGVGKSTLLQILSSELRPSSGKLAVDGRISVMRQAVRARPDETIADIFGVSEAVKILERAARGIAGVDDLTNADWTLESHIQEALARVALDANALTPLSSLSGGQRTRASLAAAIFDDPDFLFLDEPTNNLDRDGRDALLRLTEEWSSGLLVVSHDRDLLDRMDAILELTSLGATRYGGNWSSYRERKAVELSAAEGDLAHARKQQAEVERKVQIASERRLRRNAGGSRKAARGDMPRILIGARKNAAEANSGSGQRVSERLAIQAADAVTVAQSRVEVLQTLSIVLPSTNLHDERRVLEIRDASVGYGTSEPVLEHLNLNIVGPERITITGRNGAGKSTFLKLISGELPPLSGHVHLGVATAVIDQHVAFLDPELSILENFQRLNPGSDENECRAALAGFLFRANATHQIVATLSGGQIIRAGMACRLSGSTPPQLLILDEPTNHLDIESINAVEDALQGYDGAIVVVSHDQRFLANISIEREIALDDPTLTVLSTSKAQMAL